MSLRILALETSGLYGSVAVAEGGELLRDITLAPPRRTAQALAPTIAELLQLVGWKPVDVQLIAVTVGPGSFTGLRVGVVTAKTFAYAVGAEVLGVNTLAAIAERAPEDCPRVTTVVDAQRQQVFAASWRRANHGPWIEETAAQLICNEPWIAGLRSGDAVSGPALAKLLARLPEFVRVVDASRWEPTAAAVARIAWRDYESGSRDSVWSLVPQYYRLSAAEEKRAAP